MCLGGKQACEMLKYLSESASQLITFLPNFPTSRMRVYCTYRNIHMSRYFTFKIPCWHHFQLIIYFKKTSFKKTKTCNKFSADLFPSQQTFFKTSPRVPPRYPIHVHRCTLLYTTLVQEMSGISHSISIC